MTNPTPSLAATLDLDEIWIGYSERRFKPIPFMSAESAKEWLNSANPHNFGKCSVHHYRKVGRALPAPTDADLQPFGWAPAPAIGFLPADIAQVLRDTMRKCGCEELSLGDDFYAVLNLKASQPQPNGDV